MDRFSCSAGFLIFLISFGSVPNGNGDSSIDSPSGSVLEGLLESPYTDLVELIKKASMLQTLEEEVSRHNVTIFAPQNSCFEGPAQESFRRFLLEAGNLKLLQRLIDIHVIPRRVTAEKWPATASFFRALSTDFLQLWTSGNRLKVGFITVVDPNAVIRSDGVVHGVDAFIIPKIIQRAFDEWKKRNKDNLAPKGSQHARGSMISPMAEKES